MMQCLQAPPNRHMGDMGASATQSWPNRGAAWRVLRLIARWQS
jgi:hypothetical protein